ncbi:MAG: cytochrome c oxidase subunit 3 [Chitinophagales bacterium]
MQTESSENPGKEKPYAQVYVIIVHLLLAGIIILFLGLSYAYIFSVNLGKWVDFQLPKIFWLSSFCVMGISVLLKKIETDYKSDEVKKLRQHLLLALLFSFVFLVCQFTGWIQMYNAGFTLSGSPSYSYIYLLGWLHGLHIFAGILFLSVAIFKVQKAVNDPVKKLLYVSDVNQIVRLKLLSHYWHVIDALWIFIFFLFLFQHA